MNALSPQRVAIIGPGAIGCVCAAALQQTGRAAAILCGRRPSAVPIVVEQVGRPRRILETPVLTDPTSTEGPVDFVILAVKAHQTPPTTNWLSALCGPLTVVAVLQNGVEQVERVAPLVGSAAFLPVVVHCSARVVGHSRVLATTPMRLQVPACTPAERFERLLDGSGATVELVEDFITAQWKKLCLNAVAGLMAATGRTAEVFRVDGMGDLARCLGLECIRVARAEGARLDDELAEELVSYFQALPPRSGTSILTDRLASRPMEWDARNGVIRRLGVRHGIPTPVSDVLAPLLAGASRDAESRWGEPAHT